MELCLYFTACFILCNVFNIPSILASTIPPESTAENTSPPVTSPNSSVTIVALNSPEVVLSNTIIEQSNTEPSSTDSGESSTETVTSSFTSNETGGETSTKSSRAPGSLKDASSTSMTSSSMTSDGNNSISSSDISTSIESIQSTEKTSTSPLSTSISTTTRSARPTPLPTTTPTTTPSTTPSTTIDVKPTNSFTSAEMSTTGSTNAVKDSTTSNIKGVTKATCDEKESMFGTKGVAFIFGAIGICVLLVIVIIVMAVKGFRQSKPYRTNDKDQAVPKLKMLEIKDEKVKRSINDDQQTFSLDYEKHVQEKIVEHKRKKPPPIAQKPNAGVSTFIQKKNLSLRSNSSTSSHDSRPASPLTPVLPVSPVSTGSPAEMKPLIKPPEDETMVFNFTKKPSELLTTRRTSAFDEAARRRSNVSGGKTPKPALPDDDLYDI